MDLPNYPESGHEESRLRAVLMLILVVSTVFMDAWISVESALPIMATAVIVAAEVFVVLNDRGGDDRWATSIRAVATMAHSVISGTVYGIRHLAVSFLSPQGLTGQKNPARKNGRADLVIEAGSGGSSQPVHLRMLGHWLTDQAATGWSGLQYGPLRKRFYSDLRNGLTLRNVRLQGAHT